MLTETHEQHVSEITLGSVVFRLGPFQSNQVCAMNIYIFCCCNVLIHKYELCLCRKKSLKQICLLCTIDSEVCLWYYRAQWGSWEAPPWLTSKRQPDGSAGRKPSCHISLLLVSFSLLKAPGLSPVRRT